MNRFPSLTSLFILLLAFHSHFAVAQGTAFTYQGRLNDGPSRATGSYDLTFAVYSDSNGVNQIGETVTNLATTVNGGLFTVSLNFGPGIFTGPSLWLQIGTETNGDDGDNFTLLSPLQSLTPAPYSIYSATSGSSGYATAATTAYGVSAGSVSGPDIASSSVVKSLNNLQDSVTLAAGTNITITPAGNTLTIASSGGNGGGTGNSWSLTGNAGTSPGNDFLGTTDNEPLSFKVDGEPALMFEPDLAGNDAPNIIGGCYENQADSGLSGVTISGGGAYGYYGNLVHASWGTIAGGWSGTINSSGYTATISGGAYNNANGPYSAIPGGYGNSTSGTSSFAAGEYASAGDDHSFVWGDGSRFTQSSGVNTFSVLATGGIYLYTAGSAVVLDSNGDFDFGSDVRQMLNLYGTNYGIGVQNDDMYFRCDGTTTGTGFTWYRGGAANSSPFTSGGGTTLMTLTSSGLVVTGTVTANGVLLTSDRNAKENFAAINPEKVLAKVAALSISQWNYKTDQKNVQHLGPMAQDFQAAFQLDGCDDKHISMVDEGGVALAAIQGLNQKLEAQMQEKDARIADLEKRLNDLAQTVQNLTSRK